MTSHAASAAEMILPPTPQPVARASAAPALSRASAALDWIAPVRAWQTVAWEAAALAAAAGYGHSTVTEAACYAGAGALVGMTSLRVHGLTMAQWTQAQGRFRYRRLAARRRAEAEAAVEPLATLLPDLGLGGYVDRAGNRVGLAASDGGWVATVRLGAAAEPDVHTLMAVLREAFTDTTIPLAGAQLVVWTAPGPVQAPPTGDPIAVTEPASPGPAPATGLVSPFIPSRASAPIWPGQAPDPADLTATVSHPTMASGGSPSPDFDMTMTLPILKPGADLDMTVTLPVMTPAAIAAAESASDPSAHAPADPASPRGPMRVYWLALRYRPRQAPHAALARGGGELGAARAAAGAALGLVSRLDSAGFAADALDQFELGQELLVALNAGDPAPTEVRETWRDWSTGHLRQVCFEPHRSLDPAGLLERWAPEAAFTCASYTLSRTPRGRIRGESAFRIAGTDVESIKPPVPATRANGRQQEFVLRTLPLAVC